MSFRGRGRGRGGFGGRGTGHAHQVPFGLFPEIDDLGKAKYSAANIELVKWSANLQKFWNSSPYFYEDKSKHADKMQKQDLERYSDRKLRMKKAKEPLWHFIRLDADHLPAELAGGEKKGKHVPKRVRWNPESDLQKLDMFEKIEKKIQGQEGTEKKDNDEEEENQAVEESEGEASDEGDYEQNVDFDDDEDDFNMPEENDDEGEF